MIIAVIILSFITVILLAVVISQKNIIGNLTSSLRRIRESGSRESLHAAVGSKSEKEMLREVNLLLDKNKDEQATYMRKRHELDRMMTNISHDLRTPLTSAIGYVDLMKNGEISDEERARELEIVSEKLDRLNTLTDSFFEFSKIISSDTPDTELINIVSVLEESTVGFYDDYSKTGRNIDLNCDARKLEILSNRIMMLRVFDNIITNAYKHGKGDLQIELVSADKMIEFSNRISDAEGKIDTAHVFDEFYTTDISRTKGGTGLGLAIAKQFTEMLGGEISAETEGEMFKVVIKLEAKV